MADTSVEDFPTIFDPETCVRKGLCPVSQIQNESSLESHSLYYEQHGSGPEKVVFIMGLNRSSFGWTHQVEHFARIDKYSVLVFDNRGVGNSGTPRGPYTTSAMAEDVIVLLDYIGWTEERQLHITGISLGGMVSLELASRIPKRIATLSLIVTTAGGRPWFNLPPWKGLKNLLTLLTIKDPKQKVPYALDMLYPQEYLNTKAPGDPNGRTNADIQGKTLIDMAEITRPQKPIGSLSQMSAGLTHYVSAERLAAIASSIPKILILTGDKDYLVSPENSRYLANHMPGAEYVVWEKTGHAVPMQWPERFNEILERAFAEGWQKSATF